MIARTSKTRLSNRLEKSKKRRNFLWLVGSFFILTSKVIEESEVEKRERENPISLFAFLGPAFLNTRIRMASKHR